MSRNGPRFAWVNGALLPADAPHISAFDRGFQLGDAVFETLRARGGHVAELGQHLDRLHHSADVLGFSLPHPLETALAPGIAELLVAEGLGTPNGDAAIRITVSRGPFLGRGLLPPDEHPDPTIVIQAWPVTPPPPSHLERGLHLVASAIRRDPASPLAALKTTSRADYVFARLEARRAGADDALFLTLDGHLSEATSANVFIVTAGRLATPSVDCAILPGTTRTWLLGWAGSVGLAPWEGLLTTRDLLAGEEAFICSSVAGVLPVTRWQGQPIGSGRPGPWTLRAREAREAFIAGEASGTAASAMPA